METIKAEDLNNPTNAPFVQMTVLNNLLKKTHLDVLNHFSEENIKCCLIPKGNDPNKIYLDKVEKCFSDWKQKAEIPLQKLKKMAILHKDLLEDFEKKKLNCYNLVSESEMELCYNQEQKNYVQELGNSTRIFIEDFEKNHKFI